MFNRFLVSFLCVALFGLQSNAQKCDITIKGQVIDEASLTPLSYVNIFIQETHEGTTTDDQGNFSLDSICPGHYHFIISHIGCAEKKLHFDIFENKTLSITMSHTSSTLGTVVIAGKKDDLKNQPNLSVNRQTIEDNVNKSISTILENEAGIHLIKNGNGIAKPVVHGLYGNRLTILNHGIIQSGQQWGNDHSPEIDPFALDKITVLKGASAIEYGAGNLGAVILTEPKRIENEPHLHGQANYIYETNGRGHSANIRLEQYTPHFGWRVNGSLKKYGDKETADYFLNNTGTEEGNLSFQLEKSWSDRLFFDFYASSFNTKLGVLRGSHISNLTDLESAFLNPIPHFTESEFSYGLEAPKQHVSHHLIKGKGRYFFDENRIFEVVVAGQLNERKEFDVRRGGRTTRPAMSLNQFTFNSEFKYSHNFSGDWNLKVGNQNIFTDNTNVPETGILPLIPDYVSWKSGFFGTLSKRINNTLLSFGIRYDYENQYALTIDNGIERDIIRYRNHFNNVSGLFSVKSKLAKSQSLGWNIGYAMRNPGINELYSNGLHQGVSGIELGDPTLETESAIKNTLEYTWFPNAHFTFNALAYHQYFKNYIYLNPQDEIRPTIRGFFPVFIHDQIDAHIYGLDLSTQFTIDHSYFGKIKYSYFAGRNTEEDLPLIFIPPNSIYASIIYRGQRAIKFTENLKMENSEIEVSNKYVFKQNSILDEQDYLPPPPGYSLFNLKMSTNVISSKYKVRCFAKVENMFNVKYRDYLNRQRYFSDDIGVSLTIGVNVKF